MIKRVNFTNRRRIARDRVRIELLPGLPRRFNATLSLDGLSFSQSSAIFLEAMCAGSPVIERFPCGDVGHPRMLREQTLGEIEGKNVFFTLKVVDRAERYGRIEGIAENIRPESSRHESGARQAILPIEPKDLGEEIWKLEFRGENVFLLVNSTVSGLVDRAHTDPLFFSLVYPAVIRGVLERAFKREGDLDDVDGEREGEELWARYWVRFGKSLHPDQTGPESRDAADVDDWIDEVVRAFSEKHRLKDRYLRAQRGSSEGDG